MAQRSDQTKENKSVQDIIKEEKTNVDIGKLQQEYGEKRMNIIINTKEQKAKLQSIIKSGNIDSNEDLKEYLELLENKKIVEQIKKLKGVEKFIGKIETFDDLRKLSVKTLISLEDNYPGILLYAFTDIVGGKEKVDFENWKGYTEIPAGKKLKIDFRGHNGAQKEVGAADILPPSVRQITVSAKGNEKNTRTSTRRIGLVGRNEPNTGFYDERGYIPIFTGDVIEIKKTDKDFEKQFMKYDEKGKSLPLTENAFTKYNSSEEAKKDKIFIKKNEVNWMFTPKTPELSAEEMQLLKAKMGNLDNMSVDEKIITIAKFFCSSPENNIKARHCGDWVDKIYAMAGVYKRKNIYHNLSYALVGGKWKDKDDPSRRDCKIVGKFARQHHLNQIVVGSWLWINNRNSLDYAGNHSGIFLGWVNKSARIASIASWFGPQKGRQKIANYNFNNMPVTHIDNPVG